MRDIKSINTKIRKISLKMLILLFITIYATFGYSKALLLYKNSEQGYGYNILLRYVAPELRNLSIVYDAVDVESSIFESIDLRNYCLVVTCYYSPIMKNAKSYLKRLSDFLVSSGKLLIINNIGAAMDASGFNHPGLAELNSIYNLLGISYSFGWRRILPAEIKLDEYYSVSKNLSFTKIRDVELYSSISPYTVPLVSVRAIDGNTYNMAFVSPLGAVITYNYLFDDEGKIVFDIGKILLTILYGDYENFKFLVVGKDNYNLMKALDYTSLKFRWQESVPSVLSIYNAVIVLDGTLPVVDKKLLDYILSGGTVLVISRGPIKEKIESIRLEEGIFPLPPNFQIKLGAEVNYTEMPPGAIPLIYSQDGKVLSWKLNMGDGQVIFYPLDMLIKAFRGLLIQVLFSQLPVSIQPIVNSFTIFLDDFPLPAYNRKIDLITREFGDITDNDFYYNIWWPSMKKLADSLGLKYTSAFIANYNASATWPFSFQEYANTPQQRLALKELLNSNIEIGIHGYNHIPLTKKHWDEDNIKNVLQIFKIFLRNTLGEGYAPYTYVAPDNILDEFGIEKLIETFPTIKLIGTSYYTNNPLDEFQVLKTNTVLVPRTTYGYYPVDTLLQNSILALMTLGTFQYFLHPDDLFSKDRNPEQKYWAEMLKSIETFLSTMKKYYPYLRNHYSSESAEIIYNFLSQKPIVKSFQGKLVVELSKGYYLPRYYFFRTNSNFIVKGGRIVYATKELVVLEQFENKMEIVYVK